MIRIPAWARTLADCFVPYLILMTAFEPLAAGGLVDYLESGQYLSVIDAVFRGQVIYRDVYFLFGPLTYLGPALAMSVLGKTLAVLRGYFLAADLVTFLTLYLLCRLLIRRPVTAYLAGILIVIQTHHPFWASRWGGFRFAAAYASVAAWIYFIRSGSKTAVRLAGVFAALAFLHGTDMGLLSLAAGAAVLIADRSRAAVWRNYAAGALAVLAPFAVYLGVSGALPAFLAELAATGERAVWAAPLNWSSRPAVKLLFPVFVYGYASWSAWKAARPERLRLTLLVTFGALFYAYAFRSVSGPQFETSLAFCLLVAFERLGALADQWEADRSLPRPRAVVGGALALWTLASALLIPNYFYSGRLSNWREYQDKKFKDYPFYAGLDTKPHRPPDASIERVKGSPVPAWQAEEIDRVVAAIRAHSKEGDALMAFPDLAFFNFAADRRSLGRFTVPGFAHGVPGGGKELLRLLETEKPPVVLMRPELSVLARAIRREEELLPEIGVYVSRHYSLTLQTEQVQVYVRHDR